MRASVLAIAATVAAAANNQTATTKVFSLEVGTVGVHASRNQDSVLIPCKSNVCVPTGSATLEFCRKACNRETGEHDCTTNCACNGTTPGYMCAGICNKAKTADECGSPVFQTCSGEDLVCDRTPPSPAPSPSPAPTTNAPTTNAPTTSAPTTSAPTTGAPTTSEPPTHSPTFTPSPSPAPTPTAPGPVPTTNAPPTSAPSQRVRFVKLLNPGEAHLIEYYTGLYFGPGQNNANDGFIWNPSVGSIKSISGNSCLDAYVAVDHNVYVHTYPCDDSNPNQWWLYDSSLHQLRHKTHSTMCLDADPNDANKKVQIASSSIQCSADQPKEPPVGLATAPDSAPASTVENDASASLVLRDVAPVEPASSTSNATDPAPPCDAALEEPSSLPPKRRGLTRQEAEKIVLHQLFALLKASVPLLRLLKLRPSLPELQAQLRDQHDVLLSATDLNAFQIYFLIPPSTYDAGACYEFVAAKVFPVELFEFQVRKAIVTKAAKVRGKTDVPRAVAQLVQVDPVTVADFGTVVVEKLGLPACPSWVAQVVFARICHQPYAKPAKTAIATWPSCTQFRSLLGAFVQSVQFDTDSVEGALRSLLQSDAAAGFSAMDTDGSGALSMEEVVSFLHTNQLGTFPPAVLHDFLVRFDRDGDGTLCLEEFLAACRPNDQFGLHIVTPYGSFHLATSPTALVANAVSKIFKRMFWLQHSHMLANADPGKSVKMLISADNFVVRRHFGALPLVFAPTDMVESTLSNGELLVVVEKAGGGGDPPPFASKEKYVGQRVPPLVRPRFMPAPALVPAPDPTIVPVIAKPQQARTLRKRQIKAIGFPANIAAWTSVHVKKWMIYELKLPTLAHKLSQVDGKCLVALAAAPDALEKSLHQTFQVHLPLQRHQLKRAICRLAELSAAGVPVAIAPDGIEIDATDDETVSSPSAPPALPSTHDPAESEDDTTVTGAADAIAAACATSACNSAAVPEAARDEEVDAGTEDDEEPISWPRLPTADDDETPPAFESPPGSAESLPSFAFDLHKEDNTARTHACN
ncbi:hypothetical protein ACHHYP_04716 [Achlya hypogyna]|uniref:EF-hand domain-containing protein n=1 Tax=Achlya hypogyna TaxID=1202772 RepID=A0A1V9Z085_ACHHY|nr:hypothetical protein ACHHYP_04716 [Achlya hypogyna]